MTIEALPDPHSAAIWCSRQRARGQRIGYVPTMGALHAGHLSLLRRGLQENNLVCASIFVNPLQFNNPDDLRKYPRDWGRDAALLERAGCRMVYTGTLAQFFPEMGDAGNIDGMARAHVGPAARGLEGAHRPGHLQGVARIVERLLATVGACRAYFGEKDFQQTLVVKHLAQRLDGVTVVVCPTLREPSGLAMSSRNGQLSAQQQIIAATLYQALLMARDAWRAGIRRADAIEALMTRRLDDARIRLEYAAVRDPDNWSENPPRGELRRARALLAATIGEVRLIDNLMLDGD